MKFKKSLRKLNNNRKNKAMRMKITQMILRKITKIMQMIVKTNRIMQMIVKTNRIMHQMFQRSKYYPLDKMYLMPSLLLDKAYLMPSLLLDKVYFKINEIISTII
jgi:hypothetical protein